MSNHKTVPVEEKILLVAFSDLLGFSKSAMSISGNRLFEILSDYFEFLGDIVEKAGGKLVKPIGDAGLIVFPEERADDGVVALMELKSAGDRWLEKKGLPCRHNVKAHLGPVHCGMMGTRKDKRFDIYGNTVNVAARIQSSGFAVTPQVFRKLKPATRKRLKKHTPPVTYIPVEDRHEGGLKGGLTY